MHILAVPAQDHFCFLNERELQSLCGFRWYLSSYIPEVLSQQSQRSQFVWNSQHLWQHCSDCWGILLLRILSAFLENTFGAVKTIMSYISRGRLTSQSLRRCRYSYGYCRYWYCGQFSLSILFYCHFQNWNNTLYLLTLIPKINVTWLSLRLIANWKKRQHHRLLPPLHVEVWEHVRTNQPLHRYRYMHIQMTVCVHEQTFPLKNVLPQKIERCM